MAKEKRQAEAASLNPDEMLAGGLKDDFRGRIEEAVFCRWDYDGSIDEPVLAARLTIQELDEDGEPIGDDKVVQHWSAGDLAAFVPSQDGKTPCDEDEVGPFALRVGKRPQLNNNTNFAHLMSSSTESGEASKGKYFTRKDLTASLECLEGLDAHWNRVPQKRRSGLAQAEGEGNRQRDVLVITEVYGYGDAQSSGKKKPNGQAGRPTSAKSKARQEEPEDEEPEGDDDLDTEMQEAVVEKLANGKLKKGKLATLMLSAFAKDKAKKAAAVKRCTQADFLEGGPWTYDEDTGTLSLEED